MRLRDSLSSNKCLCVITLHHSYLDEHNFSARQNSVAQYVMECQ